MDETGGLWSVRHFINGPQSHQYLWPIFVFAMTRSRRRSCQDWLITIFMTTVVALTWYNAYLQMSNWDVGLFYIAIWYFYSCTLKNSDW